MEELEGADDGKERAADEEFGAGMRERRRSDRDDLVERFGWAERRGLCLEVLLECGGGGEYWRGRKIERCCFRIRRVLEGREELGGAGGAKGSWYRELWIRLLMAEVLALEERWRIEE